MVTEDKFAAFFGAQSLLGQGSVSPVTQQFTVCWNYVELVKAAVAFRHVVSCSRAIFGEELLGRWGGFGMVFSGPAFTPQRGVFPEGVVGGLR